MCSILTSQRQHSEKANDSIALVYTQPTSSRGNIKKVISWMIVGVMWKRACVRLFTVCLPSGFVGVFLSLQAACYLLVFNSFRWPRFNSFFHFFLAIKFYVSMWKIKTNTSVNGVEISRAREKHTDSREWVVSAFALDVQLDFEARREPEKPE